MLASPHANLLHLSNTNKKQHSACPVSAHCGPPICDAQPATDCQFVELRAKQGLKFLFNNMAVLSYLHVLEDTHDNASHRADGSWDSCIDMLLALTRSGVSIATGWAFPSPPSALPRRGM